MKTEHDDSPTQASAWLEQTVPGEDHAVTESSRPPVSCDSDIGELFVAELQARRERLQHWIGLLHEEARQGGGRTQVACGSRHKCRGIRIPPRAERRLGAQRRSSVA